MVRFFAPLLFCVAAAQPSTALAQAADERPARLREYLAAAATLGQVNGSVLVAEGGRVLIDTAYGFANLELGVRNTAQTRFRVASITKSMTAIAVMQLVAFLETTYGIRVGEDDLMPENFDTLGAIAIFVNQRVAGARD